MVARGHIMDRRAVGVVGVGAALLALALAGCKVPGGVGGGGDRGADVPRAEVGPAPAPSARPALRQAAYRPRGDALDLGQEQPGSWAAQGSELASEALPGADEVDPERALYVIAHSLAVYQHPRFDAAKIGMLRIGAVVPRSAEPVGTARCKEGWYRIEPEGYVCVGSAATLAAGHSLVSASARRPDREAVLPYVYGMARTPTPPFYVKVPTLAEQRLHEPELDRLLPRADREAWAFAPFEAVPALVRDGQLSPTVRRLRFTEPVVTLGRAEGKSGFAMVSFFEAGGRQWGMNAELEVLPLDRLVPVEPSAFQGLELDEETTLPVVFALTRDAQLFKGAPERGLTPTRRLLFREALPITGRTVRSGGVEYYATRDGFWVRKERMVRVDRFKKAPGWATPGRTWLDVSILSQTLVAYEGMTPVYATLVSTGADGIGDPEKTHSTIQGQFLIHTKHVTMTMDGDEVGDEFDLRDVPYVQYFTAGYALHAAYWHDAFGTPRSHGCINLSPLDARWLFDWTDPPVPERWHGALSLKEGTLVNVHP